MLGAAPVVQLRLGVELLAPDAVQARVVPAVQVAARGAGPPQPLDPSRVPGVAAGADQVVYGQVQRLRQAGERGRVGVHELLHRDTRRFRREHVLERVVVGPGLEPDLLASAPAVPGEDVGLHEFEREAQMRARVDVRDRGGDVSAVHRNLFLFKRAEGAPTPDMNRGPVSRASETDVRAASAAPRVGHQLAAERRHAVHNNQAAPVIPNAFRRPRGAQGGLLHE